MVLSGILTNNQQWWLRKFIHIAYIYAICYIAIGAPKEPMHPLSPIPGVVASSFSIIFVMFMLNIICNEPSLGEVGPFLPMSHSIFNDRTYRCLLTTI